MLLYILSCITSTVCIAVRLQTADVQFIYMHLLLRYSRLGYSLIQQGAIQSVCTVSGRKQRHWGSVTVAGSKTVYVYCIMKRTPSLGWYTVQRQGVRQHSLAAVLVALEHEVGPVEIQSQLRCARGLPRLPRVDRHKEAEGPVPLKVGVVVRGPAGAAFADLEHVEDVHGQDPHVGIAHKVDLLDALRVQYRGEVLGGW